VVVIAEDRDAGAGRTRDLEAVQRDETARRELDVVLAGAAPDPCGRRIDLRTERVARFEHNPSVRSARDAVASDPFVRAILDCDRRPRLPALPPPLQRFPRTPREPGCAVTPPTADEIVIGMRSRRHCAP